MASALSFPPQNQGLPVQNVTSGSSVDNNLLNALATYVTTGAGARNTTEQELHDLASTVIAKPGGRAHLEALVQPDEHHPERKVWKNKADTSGKIEITKTQVTLGLEIPTLDLSYTAKGAGFFVPYSGTLNAGTIYYDDFSLLTPGPATFKLHVDGLTLYVNIYRNQVYVASFVYEPIAFVFAPGVLSGNGTLA